MRCLERTRAHMEDTFKSYNTQTNPHSSQDKHKNGKALSHNKTSFPRLKLETSGETIKYPNHLTYMLEGYRGVIDLYIICLYL